MLLLSTFGRTVVSLESYILHLRIVLEFCFTTYIFKFAARRVPKGKEFLLSHATPPLPVYSTAFLFFLLLFNKIENFITSVRKLNPREQSTSSEHRFPGKEPILEFNFANLLWFQRMQNSHLEACFLTAGISPAALTLSAINFLKRERIYFNLETDFMKEERDTT